MKKAKELWEYIPKEQNKNLKTLSEKEVSQIKKKIKNNKK